MKTFTATIEDVTVYNVYANTDMTEGRGASVLSGTFLDGHAAKQWSQGRGVMGSPADVRGEARRIVRLDGDVYILGPQVHLTIANAEEVARAAFREKALAKLTPSERAALGL